MSVLDFRKVSVRENGKTHVTDTLDSSNTLCGIGWFFYCDLGGDTYCKSCQAILAKRLSKETTKPMRNNMDIELLKADMKDAALMLLKSEIITISRAAEMMQCCVVDVREMIRKETTEHMRNQ